MSFGPHLPPELLADFVAVHREVHTARLAAYEERLPKLRQDADVYAVSVLEFGVRYERAVLAWFGALPEEIAGSRVRSPARTSSATARPHR